MRFFNSLWKVCLLTLVFVAVAMAQETTGGLQGVVKDSSGAVVPNAHVVVSGTALVGTKEIDTDGSGYYRFANLPSGSYNITVSAKGFKAVKQQGLVIEVGHLPSLDITLEVGTAATTVEVTAAPPLIDTTTSRTMTNVTDDVIAYVPHGESYQSILQFAPSARNEPLMGGIGTSNFKATGGCSPTGCSNGQAAGYQVGGASDSENSYLVEGQDTANNIGGYSHTNVPFDFIDEVQVKTTGIEAEHGGALGGVSNVIVKKGGNTLHGTVIAEYNSSALNGSPNDYLRYDPSSSGSLITNNSTNPPTAIGGIDPGAQLFNPKKDTTKDFFPGFTLGGPIKKDRLWFFAGFKPQFIKDRRTVDFRSQGLGSLNFDANTQTYYTNGRLDASLTSKIRLYASWLYQYQRQSGQALPFADARNGLLNVSSTAPPFVFAHGLGFVAPNHTTTVGADFTVTPRLVATTHFSYFFENYHDFGYPSGGTINQWFTSGNCATPQNPTCTVKDATGAPLPASLAQVAGFFNVANNINNTVRNANKHLQFNQDLAWFKSGLWGTHNLKFGYQLNQLSNDIFQRYNEPDINLFVGTGSPYAPAGPVGAANCAPFVALYGQCQGRYGWLEVQDYGSYGYALSRNHGLYVQDSWTLGRGLTINAGIRFEKENLPAENQPSGAPSQPIDFGWGDKIAPRIGAAWGRGKLKVFGSYAVVNDVMKLNLAISSFGGQYWQNCNYALDTSNLSSLVPAFSSAGRYCVGPDASSQATWTGGSTPAGLTFLENQNFRTFPTTCGTCTATQEGVVPGLKPYRQHETAFGTDYQLLKNLALEARWDRRRLDHAIEDSAIFNPAIGSETFVIVNPAQGVNKTFDGFYKFLYGVSSGCTATSTPSCPDNIPAQRNYDGVEIRLTKAYTSHWAGMFSYTYSRLWGNYSGLTSTDLGDAGGGRNSPNNSRAFDEPFFSWADTGQSASGLMPTDRPNAFKGWTYYELNEGKYNATDIGLFSFLYSGSPQTSYADVGFAFPGAFPTLVAGRGKWVDITQDPATGAITVGNPRTFRTPWFAQTNLNVGQKFKITESKNIRFFATFDNLFNRRAVTAYYSQIDSNFSSQYIAPGGFAIFDGAPFYSAVEHAYNLQALLNNAPTSAGTGPITLNSQYGKPILFQLSRNIRLGLRFTF